MNVGNLQNKKIILLKGWLFFVMGSVAVGLLVARHPDPITVILLLISIWSFCRFYYFAFYVIEHYVDSRYRFAGLLDFLRYCCTSQCVDQQAESPQEVRRDEPS